MKKLLLPALLMAGAFSANAEEVVLFEDNFDNIAPWCTDKVIDNFATNDEATSTPRWDVQFIQDEEKGDYYLRNFLWDQKKGYWADGITNAGVATGSMGTECVYFGRYFLKFGKKNNQANFRFNPAYDQAADFVKEIGTPAKFTFKWGPWRAGAAGNMDVVILAVQIANGGAYEEIDRFTHELPAGSPLTWLDAEVDLTDFEITPTTIIRIQPVDAAWQADGQHRWCLDDLKVVYGTNEGGETPEPGAGRVFFEDDFSWLAPWVAKQGLGDPVGTNNVDAIGVQTNESDIIDGYTIYSYMTDKSLTPKDNKLAWRTEPGYLYRFWANSAWYTIRAYDSYFQIGFDGQTGGLRTPNFVVPEDAEDLWLTFDWCPVKNAEGIYNETILDVQSKPTGMTVADNITSALKDGDPYAWQHVEINLFEAGVTPAANFNVIIENSASAGQAAGHKGNYNFFLDNIRIVEKPTTGISNITIEDNSNAPVEYYNLQGVRVANPENGLYIRRQGKKVSKVFVR